MLMVENIPLAHAWAASGVLNFHGKGYPYHWIPPWCFADWFGSVFVTKTVTVDNVVGRMPLEKDGCTPQEFFPECISANFWTGNVVNAVSLSNFGVDFYLKHAGWHTRTEPFIISFMALGNDSSDAFNQASRFVVAISRWMYLCRAPFAIQVNLSCPNVAHGAGKTAKEAFIEAWTLLTILQDIGVPLIPKFSALTPPGFVSQISRHPGVCAVCVSNTIKSRDLSDEQRLQIFGRTTSPLEHMDGGGWSGTNAFTFTRNWFEQARKTEVIRVPVLGGCGIVSWKQAKELLDLGASGIELGSIGITHPFRVQSVIKKINAYAAQKEV